MDQRTISFALLPQSGTSFCSMTFRFSTSWTTLEFEIPNTRPRLLFSGIQFPTDRSDDPVQIKCVCLRTVTKLYVTHSVCVTKLCVCVCEKLRGKDVCVTDCVRMGHKVVYYVYERWCGTKLHVTK